MNTTRKIGHTYHLVQISPWPITTSISIGSILIGNILIYNNTYLGKEILIISLGSTIYSIYQWFKDIVIEGTYQGEHTKKVQRSLTIGFILFVVSEIVIFMTLFFAYFYNTLVPSVEVGGIWPPIGIVTIDYKGVPLLNTCILLSSGFTITVCHNTIINKNYNESLVYLILTIALGIIFIIFQYFEYIYAAFTITDSIYGASFYILTSCHGIHIIIGTTYLLLTLFRLSNMSSTHHIQFTTAAIYWHFLDAIWLILYFLLYCWAI